MNIKIIKSPNDTKLKIGKRIVMTFYPPIFSRKIIFRPSKSNGIYRLVIIFLWIDFYFAFNTK